MNLEKILAQLALLEQYLTPPRRRRLYRLATTVLGILIVQKVVTADSVAGYLQALGLLLGVAPAELAARNTPK